MLLPPFVKREDFTSDAHSIVLLPRLAALDTGVALEMAHYNALVVQAFADVAAAQQQAQQEGPLAEGLPLMHQRGVEAQAAAAGAAASQPSSSLLQSLLRSDVAPAAIRRSYPTVQSLLLSLPAHTFDAGRIPVLHQCDPHGSPFQLNSYAYDFYKHGIYRSIVRVNRLPIDPEKSTTRGDTAEQCWRIVQPIIDAWRSDAVPLEEYPAGSSGPADWPSLDGAGPDRKDAEEKNT